LTRASIENNLKKKKDIMNVIKYFFNEGNPVGQEYNIYKEIQQVFNVEEKTAEKIINEAKKLYEKINKKKLFEEQTKLIAFINAATNKEGFSTFIKSYKNLASIDQILKPKTKLKNRILLEKKLIKNMISKEKIKEDIKSIDSLTLRTFIEKFNKKYSSSLIKEQKELIEKFILSNNFDNYDFKVFLNEEIFRLKRELNNSLNLKETKEDPEIKTKTKEVIELLENIKTQPFEKKHILKVLKIQKLIKEIKEDNIEN